MKNFYLVHFLLTAFSITIAQNQEIISRNSTINQITIEDRTYIENQKPIPGVKRDFKELGYLFSDFEDDTFPPIGWVLEFTGTNYWSRVISCSGYGIGNASAKFKFYNAAAGITQSLVSSIITTTTETAQLSFDHAYASYSGGQNDQLQIEYSTDGGTNFSVLVLLNGGNSGELVTAPGQSGEFTPTSTQWATKTFNLPVGTQKIKFKAISAYGNNLYIDNIKVVIPPSNDVGMASIDVPLVLVPGSVSPQATVKNFGGASRTFIVKMTITPSGYISTKTVSDLAPNTIKQVTFDEWNANIGDFKLNVMTHLDGDVNSTNDTLKRIFSVTDAQWTTVTNINVPTYMGSGATYKNNETELFFSSGGNSIFKTEVNKYDFNTNSWEAIAPLPIPRVVMASVATMGYYFVIGGSEGTTDTYSNTTIKYNISTNSWSYAASMPDIRGWCKADSYKDSLIYVTGGYDGTRYISSVLLYNVNNDTWREASPMPIGISGGAMAIYSDKIVYVGGRTADGIVGTTYIGAIDANDHSIITWTIGAAYPPGPKFRWDAAKWHNGIIVSGGTSSLNWEGTAECYIYKVGTNEWFAQHPKLTAVIAGSAGSILTSNNVWKYIVASGLDGSAASLKTEVFVDSTFPPVGIYYDEEIIPVGFKLNQNFPNPFNPFTKISFDLPIESIISLSIFDVLGQEIYRYPPQNYTTGNHTISFDGSSLNSGVYFYKIDATGVNGKKFISVKKMILIK